MALSQQHVQHLRSLNDDAVTCALLRIESLERETAMQEMLHKLELGRRDEIVAALEEEFIIEKDKAKSRRSQPVMPQPRLPTNTTARRHVGVALDVAKLISRMGRTKPALPPLPFTRIFLVVDSAFSKFICSRKTHGRKAAADGLSQPGPNRRVQSPKLNPAPPQQNLMSEALVLFISGVTGVRAAGINGVYDRTSETSGGYALYRKRGDGSVLLEHFGGRWQVKAVSSKGKNLCKAYVAGGCAAEACTSRMWKVDDGKAFADAPLVKMVAEAEVRSCCMPSCAFLTLQPTPHPVAFPPTDA